MEKVDLKKELKHLYRPPSNKIVEVEVPGMNYLMVDGQGDPNASKSFQKSVEALFALSYTLKFMVKQGPQAVDYGVMPLEALWWADDMSAFSLGDKSAWKWTVMILQPRWVDGELIRAALDAVRRKKNPVALDGVRFELLFEGRAAQTLYIGPYADECPTIERIHRFIEACGRKPSGKHHEIYLSDMRRTDPSKLKTVLRQPMT